MSKEKVDAYKARKANRKEEIAKEKARKKREKWIGTGLAVVIVAGLIFALGLTGWNEYKSYQDSRPNYERSEMVVSDLTGILSETAGETVEESAAE